MNVTVLVPTTLRLAVEGRTRLELGVPSTADLADVLETLIRLYPKLSAHFTSDRKPVRPGVGLLLNEAALADLSRKPSRLRDGQLIYLSAAQARADRS